MSSNTSKSPSHTPGANQTTAAAAGSMTTTTSTAIPPPPLPLISNMSPYEFESALRAAHASAKKLISFDTASVEVMLAKLALYALRQVHSAADFKPYTAIRAMTHLEFAESRRTAKGALMQAKREIRTEGQIWRATQDAANAAAAAKKKKEDDGYLPA